MEKRGDFSKNLFSLQLQINTLLEEAGGDSALSLLDSLCKLSKSEQHLALKVFQRTIEKLIAGDTRLKSESDKELENFEEELFDGLLNDIRSRLVETRTGKKLSILDGGKAKLESHPLDNNGSIIDFQAARKARRGSSSKPFIN